MNNQIHTPRDKSLTIWSQENTQIFLLFLISIISVYYLPFRLNQFIFIIFIFLAYRSKKDYFWIAFFFILLDAPGRLFQGGVITDIHRIPFYPIVSGVTLSFEELFIFMCIFKTLRLKRKFQFIFRRDFLFLIYYTLIVLTYSFILGMTTHNMISTFRILLSWSFIYIIIKLMTKESEFDRFNRLIFPFVFLAIISQIYSYLTGNYFGRFLKGASFDTNLLLLSAESKQAARAADSSIILLYCFTLALFYLFSKRKVFPHLYLYFIIVISMLSVFLSATRGWIIAVFSMFFLVMITNRRGKSIKYFISIGAFAFIVIFLFSYFFPLINIQMEKTTDRVYTVIALAEGDVTAKGTLTRLDKRVPRVLNKFKESPVLGLGFSNEYFKYSDQHVGHHNILLNVGIIGFIILNFIFLKWCIQIFRFSLFKNNKLKYLQNALKILSFAFLAMYIIHSTSAQSWGWDIGIVKILFYSLILSFFNMYYQKIKYVYYSSIKS